MFSIQLTLLNLWLSILSSAIPLEETDWALTNTTDPPPPVNNAHSSDNLTVLHSRDQAGQHFYVGYSADKIAVDSKGFRYCPGGYNFAKGIAETEINIYVPDTKCVQTPCDEKQPELAFLMCKDWKAKKCVKSTDATMYNGRFIDQTTGIVSNWCFYDIKEFNMFIIRPNRDGFRRNK